VKPAVSAWDYTSAEGIQSAYDLGRRDGEAFVRDCVRAQRTLLNPADRLSIADQRAGRE
jgi:hypothetical protein